MTMWFDVDTGPKARTTDRGTSHAAAASVRQETITRTKVHILDALQDGNKTSEEIESYVRAYAGFRVSPSGLRTRRSELEKAGFVKATEAHALTDSGRRCTEFAITAAGIKELNRVEQG